MQHPTIVPWVLLAVACALSASPLPAQVKSPAGDPQSPPSRTGQPGKLTPEHAARMKAGVALFKQHVGPLLNRHCLKCHGGQWTKGGFDLGNRDSLMESGMVDKTAADSHLLLLLRHQEEPRMPKDSPRLSDEAIGRIADWIELGAPYDRPLAERTAAAEMQVTDADRAFWSFQPLQAGDPPAVESLQDWTRNEIDAYIGARLEEQGLQPSSIASKRVLLRRAAFNLTGLPPTPEQAAAFLHDDRADGYERLIDRLLQSPHYGERWARHWMDVARFAESHGYEQDYNRPHAYHYRDFLIRALNADMPYDQFVRWQLAGDELAPENPLAMMATGFLGAGVFPTQLTEAEFESARYDELDDMTATTGVALLGLSVGCARCHDHKFDPIPSRDYYRLAATFTTTIRSELALEVDPLANQQARDEHQRQLRALENQWRRHREGPAWEAFLQWLREGDEPAGDAAPSGWAALDGRVSSTAEGRWARQPDGAYLAEYPAPAKETVTLTASIRGKIGALRLEALTHPSFPRGGPGRAPNGNFALGDLRLRLLPKEGEPSEIELASARATHQQNAGSLSVAASIDDDPVSGWAVDQGGIGKDQAAVFDLASPLQAQPGDRLEVTLRFHHPNTRHTMGRVRFSTSSSAGRTAETGEPRLSNELKAAIAKLRSRDAIARDDADVAAPFEAFLAIDAASAALRSKLEQQRQAGPPLKTAKVQVSSEGVPHMKHNADGRGYPHFYPETHFLRRGDVDQKGEVMESGFLQVLESPGHTAEQWRLSPPDGAKTSFRRATLARWITEADHGAGRLAARVIVNRLWHHHFGRGLVSTPNDFGFQGERPTHPELLDFLAQDLISHGWRLKRLHKLIMTSAAFMQESSLREPEASKDPHNRWWWRREPRRLEAEAIRDSLLQVSGQLDRKMFGPGSLQPQMKRRSVYFTIKRSQLIRPMMLFDWPEHLVSIGRRSSTTIAPQALLLLNSPESRSYAESMAAGLPSDFDEAVRQAFKKALAREPTPRERELAVKFIRQQQSRHAESGRDAAITAMTDFCQSLLASNEFIYVD